jgi:hypothetical protein
METYGERLNPLRKYKIPLGHKADRTRIVSTNNPSSIEQNQTLHVQFPNLGSNDVVVPGSSRITFDLAIDSTDSDYTIVDNISRSLIKKIVISLESVEIFSLSDSDVLLNYCDLWKTENQIRDSVLEGMGSVLTKKRLRYPDVDNSNILIKTFKNKFCVPLDFELLNSQAPFFQGALLDRLSYDFEINSYANVIKSSDPQSRFTISNICLEYDVVSSAEISRMIRDQYNNKCVIYYEKILRHTKIAKNASDTRWNINLSSPSKSLKGILILCKKVEDAFDKKSEEFFNPEITKCEITIEGKPNQLFSNGLQPYQHFDQIKGFLGGGHSNVYPMIDNICKNTCIYDVRLKDYLTTKYGLFLDCRSSDDSCLHGSGKRIEASNDGISILIEKEKQADQPLDVYVYVFFDAQMNFEGCRLKDTIY